MAFLLLNQVGDLFYQIFGSGLILGFVIIIFFMVILLALKANVATILIITAPLVLGLTLSSRLTNLIELPTWIFYVWILALAVPFVVFVFLNALRN